ncbi:hypothetical protein DMC30DRAFT_347652 [Rhodotorula diobovata]|uniref:Uncharacterized protein n=1 Tax=Rhodotorula diobovata TaxID=5288 RepID=A0A5C5G2Z4_9BASI|nr:hypothetical protein DMC30DRAFT_347652 [Rhodotorula diobovata]
MPLRMKATSYDEAVIRAQKRAARKSKHRPRPRDESLTPPRNPPKPDYFGQGTDDDYDPHHPEGDVPPTQAHKRTRTDDEFLEALADAEAADRGIGAFEDDFYARQVPAYATTYGSAAGAAAGIVPPASSSSSYLGQMDEDEYAEFVRAGMWRRKNREEVERLERLEKERREKDERDRRDRDKAMREERERIRRLEERKKRKSKEEETEARKRYDEGWRKLHQAVSAAGAAPPAASTSASASSSASKSSFPLRFSDFPWPLYPPMAFPPLSWPAPTDLTTAAISSFLLPDSLPADKHKATLRQAVLAYHPDRFERYVLRVPEDKEDVRERVRELGLRVSQVLNDLAKRGA